MTLRNKFYVDLALPFCLSKAPNTFNQGADILLWILGKPDPVDEDDLQHYYDDFLVLGPPYSDQCQNILSSCSDICTEVGVPIEDSKTFYPSTCLPYLGFIVDTDLLELRLPRQKQGKVLSLLSHCSEDSPGTKRELLSLVGFLQHCTQTISFNDPFFRRLIDLAHSVLSFIIPLGYRCVGATILFDLSLNFCTFVFFVFLYSEVFLFSLGRYS